MAKLLLQNRTRNPYKVPRMKNEIDHAGLLIPVGMTGEIDAEKHALLMKVNKAYHAMIAQNKLKASPMALEEVSADELENTSTPEKPADLEEPVEAEGSESGAAAVSETKSIEVVEVAADAPKKAPKKAGKKK